MQVAVLTFHCERFSIKQETLDPAVVIFPDKWHLIGCVVMSDTGKEIVSSGGFDT